MGLLFAFLRLFFSGTREDPRKTEHYSRTKES